MKEFEGKGSKQRPYDKEKFESNFDKIFGKNKPTLKADENKVSSKLTKK